MHQIMYAIVEAETEEEALSAGNDVFQKLVDCNHTLFDYYVTFDERKARSAGKGRWDELPAAAKIQSEPGRQLVERGWESVRKRREKNFNRLGEPSAFEEVIFYDSNGNGIWNREQFNKLTTESDNLWIIPADLHF